MGKEIVTKEEAKNAMFNQTQDAYYLNDTLSIEAFEAIKISKDLKSKILNVKEISKAEIRNLVKLYYQIQSMRLGIREQIRSIEKENNNINTEVLDFILTNVIILEKNISNSLELFCKATEEGRWLLSITGIGPVLAAGLLGYLDVTDKQYASQFISYAGLNDNNRPWLGNAKSEAIIKEVIGDSKKITDDMVMEIANRTKWSYNYLLEKAYNGKSWSKQKLVAACAKIPYNKDLKVLMYKVGSSFQWQCNNEKSLYGKLFNERRQFEMEKNENGEYTDQAKAQLEKNWSDKTSDIYKSYEAGKLPKGHINMRAMRWTEKIFLSHLFEEMYRVRYNKVPPRYYALDHLNGQHNKEILPEVDYTPVTD